MQKTFEAFEAPARQNSGTIRLFTNFNTDLQAEFFEAFDFFRTFALSIGTMEFGRRAPKICFQAWQNLRPAQSVKKKSRMETKENQNKN
jgi:hypothetical protein